MCFSRFLPHPHSARPQILLSSFGLQTALYHSLFLFVLPLHLPPIVRRLLLPLLSAQNQSFLTIF